MYVKLGATLFPGSKLFEGTPPTYISLSCLGGNYFLLKLKINYIPINWQFIHWGNAYARYGMIPHRKMDRTLSVCQTLPISLKVRQPPGCQPSPTKNLLVTACWSQVFSQNLQSVLTRLDDLGKQTWKQALHYTHVILLSLTSWKTMCDSCPSLPMHLGS